MSKVVDERIVEMRFDNKQFESNVSQSMSTLQKLKQSLNLKGASKGLNDVGTAAKKVDMNPLSRGVETVTMKFSAMQVMATTALVNITNQAVNAGKRIVSALTIDPVRSGFKEYETQINAVQTILANTQKEGATIERVNAALDELNAYADLTIYNFTEMTRNIGTFTAAGVDLDTSVNAIQGIANLAAISGSTSQQASVAMYQLSQALSSGTVRLMDWNSVVNAGMGGQVFQDALKETSKLLGTGAEAAIAAEGSFRESLKTGWLTADVLTETLKKFTTSGANEYVAEYTGLSVEAVKAALDEAEARYGEADAIEKASEALAEKSGKNKEEIKSALQFAKTAEDAATKVKTLTQLWDALKEAAQSGWAQTWRLIVGDFEEAKSLYTPLFNFLSGIINKMSEARNTLLASALGKGFKDLSNKFKSILEPVEKTAESMKKVTNSIADLGNIVDEVILGKFGNGQARFDALTKAGYNWCEVQNKVNEKLGNSYRYAVDQATSNEKLSETQTKVTDTADEESEATAKLTDEQKKQIKELVTAYKEKDKDVKLTKEQTEAIEELISVSEKLGIPVNDLIDNIDEINGRWLLIDSFKNIGKNIVKVFSSIGEAWRSVFKAISPDQLFDGIASFHKFTSEMLISDGTAKKITNTFKGLFSILHIITTIVGGTARIAFTIISKILGAMGYGILDVTSAIGSFISKIHDFIYNNKLLNYAIELIALGITKAIDAIKNLWNEFKNLSKVKNFIDAVKEVFNVLESIDTKQLGKDIIEGFKNGLSEGVSTIVSKIGEIASKVIETFCDILGIHSPSTVFYEFGRNIVQGLVNGIKSVVSWIGKAIKFLTKDLIKSDLGLPKITEALKFFVDNFKKYFGKFINFVKSLNLEDVLQIGTIGALILFAKGLFDIGKVIFKGIEGINNLVDAAAGALDGVKKIANSYAKSIKTKNLLRISISIAILAGALIALTFIPIEKLYDAVGIIIVLAGILVALALAMDKLNSASASFSGKEKSLNLSGFKTGLISISLSLLLLAAAVKMIGSMKPSEAMQAFTGLVLMIGAFVAVIAAFGILIKTAKTRARYIKECGTMILQISIAALILSIAAKRIAKLSFFDMGKAAVFMLGFIYFISLLVLMTQIDRGKQVAQVGGLLIKISIALYLLVGVVKLISMLSIGEMAKGFAFLTAFAVFIGLLTALTTIKGENSGTAKIGGTLLAVSFSLLMLVGVCKLIGMLSKEELIKGGIFIGAFLGFIALLVKITTVTSETEMARVAGTILAISFALTVMAVLSIILSMMSIEGLAKGVGAVSVLGLIMAAMIYALKGAQNVKKSLTVLVAAIAILVISVILLSRLNPKSLAISTAALVSLMLSFAAMEKCLPKAKSEKLAATIGIMALVIILLAGILVAMDKLKVDNALKNAAGLSVLMLAFSASLKMLDTCKSISKDAYLGIGVMYLVTLGLAAILAGLSALKIKTSMSNVLGLSVLMLAFSASLKILGTCKSISKDAYLGMFALVAVIGLLGLVLWELNALKVKTSISQAAALSLLLISLSACTVILSVAGYLGPGAALAGVAALAIVVAGVGGLIAAIGALSSKFPQLEEFLDKGIPILEKIGHGLGSFFGNIVAGFAGGVLNILPKFGQALSGFMLGATPFIVGLKMVDSSVLEGMAYLTGAIIALSAAELISGITSFLSFGSSFGDLGLELSKFMVNSMPFIAGIKMLDPDTAKAAKNLADMVLALTAADLINGISKFINGGVDFSEFGTQLCTFAESLVDVSTILTEGNVNPDAINVMAKAGESLAKLQGSIAPTGGLMQELTGVGDLSEFGDQIKSYAGALKIASRALSNEDGSIAINGEAFDAAAEAGKGLAKLQGSIAPTGGLMQELTGVGDLSEFGGQIKSYASALKMASRALSNEDGSIAINVESFDAAAEAGKGLAKLQGSIAPVGGIMQELSGVKSLRDFGGQIKSYASALKMASRALSNEDGSLAINEEAFSAAAKAGKGLAKLQGNIEPIGGLKQAFDGVGNLGDFGNQVESYFKALKKASDSVSGEKGSVEINEDAIKSAVKAGKKLAELQGAIPEDNWFNGKIDLSEFGTKIAEYGSALSGFSESVSGLKTDKIDTTISCGNRLVSFSKNLSNFSTEGVENFKVTKIADAITNYYNKISGITPEKLDSSVNAATKLRTLIANLVGLDNSGIALFTPEQIGTAMNTYSTKVGDINTDTVESSVNIANRLRNFITSLVGLDTSGVGSFKEAIESLGSVQVGNIANVFNESTAQMVSVGKNIMLGLQNGIISGGSSVISAIGSIISGMAQAVSGKQGMLITSGHAIMTGFANSLRSGFSLSVSVMQAMLTMLANLTKSKIPMFRISGINLINALITGIKSRRAQVMVAAKSALSGAVTSIRTYYSNFKEAGKYLGDGLIYGMQLKSNAVYWKGYELGKAAAKGVKAGAQEKSPSKLTKQYGIYIGEGLIVGMNETLGAVYRTGKEMGESAAASIFGALNGISDAANLDYEPTIRPVVDLNDLQNGGKNLQIGADISSRLLSEPVNTLQNIISNAQANIDASNAKVINAINGLRNDLNAFYEADDKEIALYMDSRKVASTIAKPMNRELNILAKRGAY